MESKKSKVDIIVEFLGTDNPEVKRLADIHKTIMEFTKLAENEEEYTGPGMDISILAEWKALMDKYYPLAEKERLKRN